MLGESAFSGCSNLRTVNFNNVEIIGKDAFRGTALTDIDFSKTKIKEIGAFAFSGLDLVDVAMPSSITHIGVSAFEKCEKLKTFSIPINANLSILSDRCLKSCSSLRAIDLGKVEKIGNGVFALCTSLKTIKWSDSLKEIGATAFMTCTSLSEIIIPNSVHSIDDWAFYECSSVEKLIVGDSTKTIGVECFSLSSSLKDIFIGQSVEKIKKWAFRKVNSLQNFSIKTNSLPALEKEVFSDVDLSNATLKVKEDLVEEYKAAEQWKEFGSIVSYKDTRNTLPEYTPFTLNNNKITAIGYHIAVYDFSGNLIIQGFDQVDLMMKHLQPTLILIKLHNERYQYTTKLAIQ